MSIFACLLSLFLEWLKIKEARGNITKGLKHSVGRNNAYRSRIVLCTNASYGVKSFIVAHFFYARPMNAVASSGRVRSFVVRRRSPSLLKQCRYGPGALPAWVPGGT